MKRIYSLGIINLLFMFVLHAQTCQKTFIEKLKAICPSKIEQFNNQIKIVNKEFVTKDRDSINIIYVGQSYQKFLCMAYDNKEYEENESIFRYLLNLNAELYFVIPEKPFVYYAWLNNRIHKIQYDSKTESVIENIIEKE